MRWKGGKRWAFVTPALFPGPCPLNNPLELGLFPGQLLVGRNAGNCISQIETRWSSASITLSGSPHRSVWSVTFHHSLLLCSCPMSAFKTTNIFGKWLQPGKHMQTFFCWAVTHLEAHLGFLLSTVNTCCFIPCQKKKKKSHVQVKFKSEENRQSYHQIKWSEIGKDSESSSNPCLSRTDRTILKISRLISKSLISSLVQSSSCLNPQHYLFYI